MRTKLLAALAICAAPLFAACAHGYVGVGVNDGRYYGHHEYAYRQPVVVEQRPVIVHDDHHDDHRDWRSANDRW